MPTPYIEPLTTTSRPGQGRAYTNFISGHAAGDDDVAYAAGHFFLQAADMQDIAGRHL